MLSLSAGQSVVLYVGWQNASGSSLGKIQVAATKTAGTTTLSGTLTAPANATQAQPTISVENAVGTADLYFDNVQLTAAGTGTLQNISAQLASLTPNTTYHYRTVATSSAGTSYGPDQTFTTAPLPTSTASSPAMTNQTTFAISYTAAGSPGGPPLAQVALYAQAPGQTGYTKVATNTSGSGSGSFSYTATAGDGSYGFYTVATDNAGNVQATPAGAQATTVLDTHGAVVDGELAGADQPDELQRLLHGR